MMRLKVFTTLALCFLLCPEGISQSDGSNCVPVLDGAIAYTSGFREIFNSPYLTPEEEEQRFQEALLQLSGYTNQAFANSQVSLRIRIVHVEEVSLGGADENLNPEAFWQALNVLRPSLFQMRDQYMTDFIALMVKTVGADNGGVTGGAPNLFMVSGYFGSMNLSFAHELGHTLGCAHDRETYVSQMDPNSIPPPPDPEDLEGYAYGYISPDGSFGDIMSYAGHRIPYFSNPNVLYEGVPTGVADYADTARRIREQWPSMESAMPGTVWVDFSYSGIEDGNFQTPFRQVGAAVQALTPGASLFLKSGTSPAGIEISKPMEIQSCGGASTLGE